MTIEEALSAIKNAIYGKDVRQAMHDGILQAEGGAGTVAKEAAKSAKEAEASAKESEIASRAIEGKADQAVTMARSANSKSDSTQLQLDEIVIDGDSSVEAAQARVDIKNISYATLKDRLDTEQQEVNAQLAQIANGTFINALNPPEGFSPVVPDANYYDEVNKKYYKDEEMTIPATDNRGRLTALVYHLHQNGGGTILLPEGKICFRSGVKWESDVSLLGAGMSDTELVVEGELFDMFYSNKSFSSTGSDANNPAVWHNNCRFENFSVDLIGLTSPYNSVGGKAFFILYMNKPVFRNLILKNTIGTALGNDFLVHGVIENVWTYNAGRNWGVPHPTYGYIKVGQSGIGVGTGAFDEEPLVIRDCFTFNSGNYGIFVETQRTNMRSKFAKIINCFATENRIGFGNRGSGATLFDGVTAYKNKEDGIRLRLGSSGDQIVNSQISYNVEDGISMEGDYLGNVIIENNDIHNNRRGIVSGGDLETETSIKDLFIQHNKVHYNSEAGIYLARSLPVNENYVIDGNKIYSNGVVGLHVAGVDGLNVLNNVFYDKQDPALQTIPLQIENLVKKYHIDGNDFGQDLQYRFYSLDGKIGDNKGLSNVAQGTATFEDGSSYVNITHNLGKPFETVVPDTPVITITPYRNPKGGVWVSDYISRNGASLFRENTVGNLTVNWIAMRS